MEQVPKSIQEQNKFYNKHVKESIYRYRNKNKDKINEQRRKLYEIKKLDPEYIKSRNERANRYYHSKKLKNLKKSNENI